jgi:ribosome-binding factor A
MAKGYRKPRLEKEMLRQIAELIAFGMKDPRLSLVTVTRVELSADFSVAKVFVSPIGEGRRREEAVGLLNRARGFVQSHLRRGLSIRQVPELRFTLDKGLENVQRVEKIFRGLDEERRASARGEEE